MSGNGALSDVGTILADETARSILEHISEEAMSANQLCELVDASEPTVYRRLEDLRRCDLVVERTKPDLVGGHHRTEYTTNLNRIVVDLDRGELVHRIERHEDMSDRFTRLIEEM